MAANTTIQIPDGVVVYTAAPNGTDPKPLDRSNPSVYKEGLMTLPHQWVLYIGVKYSDNPPNSNFGGLAAGLPVYTQTDNGPLSTWEYQSLAPSVASLITYFVPHDTSAVDPAATLQYASISAEVAGRAGLPTAPLPTQTSGSASISASNTTLSSTSASSTSPSSTSPSSAFLNGTSSIVTSTNTDPADIASAASISAVASLKHTTIGAAIGGSIGGLVIGIAAALIALACLRRRALQGSGKHSYRSGAGDATTDRRLVSLSKEMQFVEAPTAVTGWQKHLPQEKDDRAICEAVKTVFDQIQVHTEGFYNSKPGKLISSAADLGRISPDGFSKKLSKASNSLPILEGILIRWIVQRISLRADVEDSFLPFEYTNIPKQNGWHMESDEQSSNHVVESRKGFPQAFSKWRTLTGFLCPDPRADQDFKKNLDTKIDQGVRALTEAFSPWDMNRRSIANRNGSLRKILHLSYDAGVLLFAQPSTFTFDWSNEEGSVTVSPALIKRLDEFAEPLPNAPILIAARRVDL